MPAGGPFSGRLPFRSRAGCPSVPGPAALPFPGRLALSAAFSQVASTVTVKENLSPR